MRTGKIPHSFSVILTGVKPIGTQAIGRAAVFPNSPTTYTLSTYTATLISESMTHSKFGISSWVLLAYTLMVNGAGYVFLK